MTRFEIDTLNLASPDNSDPVRDPLNDHLTRIVRRALRRPDNPSAMTAAIRDAAERLRLESDAASSVPEELHVRVLAKRLATMMAPTFRDAAGHAAHRETVFA